ncbi:MAG: tRNA pseudouridine synthase A [candidate division TM6 bacterium GW2011_GWE2_41_16]|nr:MAG: tRNA pseudouridine synthase A [candidate division TM6 bacterium GW2011_GWE2_41_16]
MKPYRCIIAYDGTEYCGWQEQAHDRTIAGTLQKTFFAVFKKDIKVVGASRTDAGVHALGQHARFYTDLNIDPSIMRSAWNAALPKSISIISLEESPIGFHPQHNVLSKTYWYHIFYQEPLPFYARYGTWLGKKLDQEALIKALMLMEGTHDFRPLSSDLPHDICTIRTVNSCTIEKEETIKALRIVIQGKSFVRYMVRRMVGAAIHCEQKKCPLEYIQKVLKNSIIDNYLPVAPAQGLILKNITYAPLPDKGDLV